MLKTFDEIFSCIFEVFYLASQTSLESLKDFITYFLYEFYYKSFVSRNIKKLYSLKMPTIEDPEFNNKLSRAQNLTGSTGSYAYILQESIGSIISLIISISVFIFIGPYFLILFFLILIPGFFVETFFIKKMYTVFQEFT